MENLSNNDEQRRAERDLAIRQFLDKHAPGPHTDLLANMVRTVCRLSKDETERGDLKMLDRSLAEFRYAFKTFAPFRHVRKVSIFGSSRTPEDHADYHQAVKFAERMRAANWMVITGAGDGIMKAGHGGAGPEASFGVAIRLPFEQQTNTFIRDNPKLVNFHYFFTRKLLFVKEASAVALFPGGFGTQDEGFEVMTLIQTGKAALVPIVLVDSPGGTYWQHWRTWVQAELLRTGMISPEDMHLFKLTDDIDVAVNEILRFYRRYHSARIVRDNLVLRLTQPLPAHALDELNTEYPDILSSGKIEAAAAHADEADDFPELPRLSMHFNRRSHGRLRTMIDKINAYDPVEAREPAAAR